MVLEGYTSHFDRKLQGVTRLPKITERILINACRSANNCELKTWDSGLKIEPTGDGYTVIRLFRRPRFDQVASLSLYYGPPREVMAFISGFVSAVVHTTLYSNETESSA